VDRTRLLHRSDEQSSGVRASNNFAARYSTAAWDPKLLRNTSIPEFCKTTGETCFVDASKDFADAFNRYLSVPGQSTRDTVTSEEQNASGGVTTSSVVTDEKLPATEEMSRCHAQNARHNDAKDLFSA
jgi:hypothetical protein